MLNTVAFYLFSIIALAFLIFIIYKTAIISNIKLDKREKIAVTIGIIVSVSMYIFLIFTRKYIYQWDNSVYYFNQLDLLAKFNASFFSGIKEIISTTYRSDYGDFLLSFTSGIFSLTNQTPDSFVMTYFAVGVIPIIIIYSMIVKKILQITNSKNNIAFYISIAVLATLPVLHKASIMGQPDLIGLIFVGLIILLTIDYDFSIKDRKRTFLVLLFTAMLLVTRRWYMFWALGYFATYASIVIIKAVIRKDKIARNNIIEFSTVAILLLGIVISPIIYRTLKNNYQSSYGAWLEGGTGAEIIYQILKVGILYTIIMILGIAYGLLNKENKELRVCTIQSLFTWIIALLSFTRIQNMGDHHTLILVPTYIILFTLGIIAISKINKKYIKLILEIFTVVIVAGNAIISILRPFSSKLFSNVILRVDDRTDLDNIKKMTDFIINNCDKENKAYINAGSGAYNNTTFANVYLPKYLELNEIMPYSLSIDSVHGFPKDILTCKYVFTSNITLSDYSADNGGTVIPKINNAIMNDQIISSKFTKTNEFKMSDKVTFYAYMRIEKIDNIEKEEWLKIFEEQCKKYPSLFTEKINSTN